MHANTPENGWVDTNSLLIEEVRQQPCLYDRSHRRYSDNKSKPPIWEAIAHKLGFRRGRDAQNKWNYLRGHYATILRRQAEAREEQERDPKASPIHVQSNWDHFEQMAFLRPFVKKGPENETLNFSLEAAPLTPKDTPLADGVQVKKEVGHEAAGPSDRPQTPASTSPAGSLHGAENRPPRPRILKRPRLSVLPPAAPSDDFELQVFTAYLNDRLNDLPVKKRRAAEFKILVLLNQEEDAA